MGKYTHLKDKIEAFQLEPKYAEKVQEQKFSYEGFSLLRLGQEYQALRKRKDELAEEEKRLNLEIEAVSQLVLAKFEADDLTKASIEGIGTLSCKDEPYAGVEDKEKLMAWILNGHAELLMVSWQQLNSQVKEALIEGEELPPGVKVFMKSSLTLRKE